MIKLIAVFLITSMIAVTVPLAMAETGQQGTTSIFRFTELPHPDYYFRSYKLVGLKPVRDLRHMDSDIVIRGAPQSENGFQAGWLQPYQVVAAVAELTEITMADRFGNQVMIVLKVGESVVYDTRSKEILAVVRCANKVIGGNIKLPEPEKVTVRVPVEKKTPVPQRETGPISVYQDNRILIIWPPPYHEEKKEKKPGWWSRKGWWVITLGGLAGAGLTIWFAKDKEKEKNWRQGRPPL